MGNRWHEKVGLLLGLLVAAEVGGTPRTVDAGLVAVGAERAAAVETYVDGGPDCEARNVGEARCVPIEVDDLGALAPPVMKQEPAQEEPGVREPEPMCPDPNRRNLEPPQRPGLPPVEPPPGGPQLPPMPGLPEPGNPGCG